MAELTQWLAQEAPAEGVKNVAVHVGVNDCLALLSPIVTSQQWKTLLLNCQHVFPSAKLKASGIVPARGRHTASTAIRHSNTNLQAVCRDMGVMFIDHAPNFTAPSGAPKMALYKDAIHPNKKGTVCLALSLFPQKITHSHHASPPAISSLADYPPLTPHRVRNFPPLTPRRVRSPLLPTPPGVPAACQPSSQPSASPLQQDFSGTQSRTSPPSLPAACQPSSQPSASPLQQDFSGTQSRTPPPPPLP